MHEELIASSRHDVACTDGRRTQPQWTCRLVDVRRTPEGVHQKMLLGANANIDNFL